MKRKFILFLFVVVLIACQQKQSPKKVDNTTFLTTTSKHIMNEVEKSTSQPEVKKKEVQKNEKPKEIKKDSNLNSKKILENKKINSKLIEKPVIKKDSAKPVVKKEEKKEIANKPIKPVIQPVRRRLPKYVQHLDITNEIVRILNQKRIAMHYPPVKYSSTLFKTAAIRSSELATICNLKPNGRAHTRLDGSSWDTSLGNSVYYTFGENLASFFESDDFVNTSPSYFAQKFFNLWWNSPGHKQNMLDSVYDEIGVSIHHCIPKKYDGYHGYIAAMILGRK